MPSTDNRTRYEVTLRRGPRLLRVRESFASYEAARAYVRDQWARRALGEWFEPEELPGAASGQRMILAGNESYWIGPAAPVGTWARRPAASAQLARVRQPSRLSFEAWIRYAFDHPVPEDHAQAWYWQHDNAEWDETGDPDTTVRYLTRLFEDPAPWLHAFSDAQIAQGLGFLINNALSSHMFPLMDPDVSWTARHRCIRAMYRVFERVFAPRCSHRLSHVLTAPDASINPLNGVCYMWWDVCPLQGNAGPAPAADFVLETEDVVDDGPRVDPHAADLEEQILEVMRATLQLESVACQEAALHGLGHRAYWFADRVEAIVDEFVQRRFPTWPEDSLEHDLRGYALAAKRGRVQ